MLLGNGVRGRAGGGDDVARAHEAEIGEIVEQAHARGPARAPRYGSKARRAVPKRWPADRAPGRVDDPVRGDADALARHVVRVGAADVVHDAARGGVDVLYREHVIAPFGVEIGGGTPGEHRRVHLRVRPGIAARLGHVGVAELQVDLPADRVHHRLPGVAGTAGSGLLGAVDRVDLDRASAEIARQPAHRQAPDDGAGRVPDVALGVVGRRRIAASGAGMRVIARSASTPAPSCSVR